MPFDESPNSRQNCNPGQQFDEKFPRRSNRWEAELSEGYNSGAILPPYGARMVPGSQRCRSGRNGPGNGNHAKIIVVI